MAYINSPRVIDAYLIYKFACFNKPEQDLEISQNPLVETPYIDIDACQEYNERLEAFVALPLSERVDIITSSDQHFCVEQTIEAHFIQIAHNMIGYQNCYTYREREITSVSVILNDFNRLSPERKVVLFHFLDIYHNDPSERNSYPFLRDIIVFNHRIASIEETFMWRLCDMIYGGSEPTHALLASMWEWWNIEQEDPNGIHIIIEDEPYEIHGSSDAVEDLHNTAFIANEAEAIMLRNHIEWDDARFGDEEDISTASEYDDEEEIEYEIDY